MIKRELPAKRLLLLFAFLCSASSVDAVSSGIESQDALDPGSRVEASPSLAFRKDTFVARAPHTNWHSGPVSSVAVGSDGLIYELQRGLKADPVLVLDFRGRIIRSWGKGDFKIPHSIRLDPVGNVWTVDAAQSTVTKYSPTGKKLLTIAVGEQPQTDNPFAGTTDVAFAPNGHVFITDGYGNARILEYTADGRRLKEWGKLGTGAGELHLPHAIQIGSDGTIYVADRENGRIEKFDMNGSYIGEIAGLGRIYSIKVAGDLIWASLAPLNQPPGSAGWVVKLDRNSGEILGHINVQTPLALHAIDLSPAGEPITTFGNKLLWFRRKGT